VMNCDQGSYAESPTLYAAYVAYAAVSDRKLCCGSGAVAPSEWRCRIWVKSVVLSLCQPLPVYPHQRTSSDRCGWSGWRKKKDRENRKCNIAKRQSTFPASQTTTENCPAGKSPKTCPAPLTKIFRLTRRANHLYKLAPSHPRKGRIASRHERAVGCDGRDSVGRAGDRRAGLPVSDRTVRGRTTLPTVLARTRRAARRSARSLAWAVADGEVVWSWRPDAGVKSCGDPSGPTGFEMYRQSARRRWQTSRSPGRARSKP
jgi:hypothetical protein